jgi:peptidoglycan hydrolase-like protein with peptidoglycan-binding domain
MRPTRIHLPTLTALAMAASLAAPGLVLAHGMSSEQGGNQPGQAAGQLSSSEIKDVQNKLNDKGYDAGKADGIFGKKTAQAISKFQKDNHEQVTGKPDSTTLSALGVKGGNQQAGQQARQQSGQQPGQQANEQQAGQQQGSNQQAGSASGSSSSGSDMSGSNSGSNTGSSDTSNQ